MTDARTVSHIANCGGWAEVQHKAEWVIDVFFDGCEFCGGFECGDTVHFRPMCQACIDDMAGSGFSRYEIMDNSVKTYTDEPMPWDLPTL